MAELKLRGVGKVYDGGVRVLSGIDLDVADGEFLVLVGPSGCGKSTLLRMIAGLEHITEGTLEIDGRVVNDVAPKDRDVAMVFQSYALYPHMTVRQNMGFSLQIRRTAAAEMDAKVEEAARMLGLSGLLDRLPRELSGGQRQRVAIGRAIVRRPRVFLFDEPLSNLDANLRGQMRVELKALHRDLGTTMIYVTHDQIEAMTLADRICLLEGGHARQVDTPSGLYDRPDSRFVASFIGSPPMNFLPLAPAGNRLTAAGISIPMPAGLPSDRLRATVDVGLRPHELGLAETDGGSIDATVDLIEMLGWDALVHARCGDVPVLAQIEAHGAAGLEHGAPIRFWAAPGAAKLFDHETGRAIKGGGAA
ncbi:MAG TPA: sn-glycerol-3-phosphate ABC transporter ATP-binding protein UgpC [Myxococcota bacterium]|nr:sn-glycerol-3-phosphate ABC transporter ATP-binding protein UgpC [Myxococcota bacterium]HOC98717.1 sn-glycerol-3-phosphate ABC transporter ATP-binding protein UgpC [Myxococcota bacterium]HOH76086.1 sn-glycerol-3-phosphate ABC transporter ATP-binding protein UgpC [Myxococcota bacterium]